MSAAGGGGGNAARALHEGEATTQAFDLDAAKAKVTGRERARVHLRVVSETGAEKPTKTTARHSEESDEDDEEDAGDETARPHRRFWPVRARTINIMRLSKREIERGRMMYPEAEMAPYYAERPRTRAACLHGEHAQRPCPWLSCTHHLFFDVSEETGSIKCNFPPDDDSPEALVRALTQMRDTCALDVADRGGITLEEVGERLSITRERTRQLETRAIAKLKVLDEIGNLSDWIDVGRCLSRRTHASPTSEHDGEGEDGPMSHGLMRDAVETVERIEESAFDPIAHGVGLINFLT